MIDVLSGLQKLGFSTYEAKVYTALVGHPNISGYEVSKYSGVPRAKVYEVLEGLVRRGVVLISREQDKQLYQPLPNQMLLERHMNETEQVVNALKNRFAELQAQSELAPFITLREWDSIVLHIEEMCQSAARSLLVSGFPPEYEQLQGALHQAERAGRKVFALVMGESDVGLKHQYLHHISPMQYRQVEKHGRWFALIRDMEEAILVQVKEQESIALWSRNMGLILALSMWIRHDIAVNELLKVVGDKELALEVSTLISTKLQELWDLELD